MGGAGSKVSTTVRAPDHDAFVVTGQHGHDDEDNKTAFMQSWIANSVIQHDNKYGADLDQVHEGRFLCQITNFTTFRTSQDPHAIVHAVVADRTHWVNVAFDPDVTEKHERSIGGEEPERLTSHLRATVRINQFQIQLTGPIRREGVEPPIPRVQFLVLSWDIVGGDRRDSVFFPGAREVGTRTRDTKQRKVLRKWWAGITSSQVSAPHPSIQLPVQTPIKPMSRASSVRASVPPAGTDGRGFIPMQEALARSLGPHAKKRKPVPMRMGAELISPDQQELLKSITVFGVNIGVLPEHAAISQEQGATSYEQDVADAEAMEPDLAHSNPSNGHSQPSNGQSGGSLESQVSYPSPAPTRHTESAGGSSPAPATPLSNLASVDSPSPAAVDVMDVSDDSDADDAVLQRLMMEPPARPAPRSRSVAESSECEEIPIRKPYARAPVRRQTGAAFAVAQHEPSPSPPVQEKASSPVGGDTDDEDLSDYELQQRNVLKATARKFDEAAVEESLSQSQDSSQFDLSKYAPTPSVAPKEGVLVETTDESDPKEPATPAPPATKARPPTSTAPAKRPRWSTVIDNAPPEPDAEATRVTKRPREPVATPEQHSAKRLRATVATPLGSEKHSAGDDSRETTTLHHRQSLVQASRATPTQPRAPKPATSSTPKTPVVKAEPATMASSCAMSVEPVPDRHRATQRWPTISPPPPSTPLQPPMSVSRATPATSPVPAAQATPAFVSQQTPASTARPTASTAVKLNGWMPDLHVKGGLSRKFLANAVAGATEARNKQRRRSGSAKSELKGTAARKTLT